MQTIRTVPPGRVILVGAGPGDPELLTLKAVRAIASADVLLIDDLVNLAVLEHARPEARRVAVGKRGGCESTPQEFIERLMFAEARAGRTVVRLKGGDPFVFGRGGEECAHLRALGIAVEVVPGITSGVGAASAAGIPVTHRDCSQGVAFVTGHSKKDGRGPDWAALARSGLTLVVYMGMARSRQIAAALAEGGMRADMPVAVVQNGTREDQRRLVTRLDRLADDIAAQGFASPAVIIIGEVVAMAAADSLDSLAADGARQAAQG
ncbi:uroporphyrinogen-III C-methyltransferase [Derxia gummosa]|uniref:uroporphyrinogen-III C-methyltransferase n=1 Tax=Derxia gummosa DSM 723 TaxID=1121388 RepID=A0A8B6X614_9BURK|nr:uroporphyrinogen-III C-methyltransferase [Derxia gummosa]